MSPAGARNMAGSRRRRGFLRQGEILLYIAVFAFLGFAVWYQNQRFQHREFRVNIYRQKIKLPASQTLKFITLGYDNIYANWLWLQAIQAFGSGWRTEDGSTKPIYQYFDTLTDLDPHFISAYRFANLVIGDHHGDHALGQEILRKGVHKNPLNYQIPYLGIYNAIWSTDDANDARWFARRIRRIPETPAFMRRLEEYVERKEGRYEVAMEFNIRYYLEYLVADNDVEREIAERRMRDLLDRHAREQMTQGLIRYEEINGTPATRMEDILRPEYMPPFETSTFANFGAALQHHADDIERLSKGQEVPESLVQAIARQSRATIAGLPPEPYGTWYYIWTPRRDFLVNQQGYDIERLRQDRRAEYIYTARDAVQMTNDASMIAQSFILAFIKDNNRKPTDEDLKGYLGRDPLGGHYVYEPDAPESPVYGMYYSTGARRISEGRDPRAGAMGPGPFPLPLEPSLTDFEDDMRWGLESGYIDLMGQEHWQLPSFAAP